ncbi:MAG: hypothetical protein AAB269_02695, partial [Bacteroidota bacterium]
MKRQLDYYIPPVAEAREKLTPMFKEMNMNVPSSNFVAVVTLVTGVDKNMTFGSLATSVSVWAAGANNRFAIESFRQTSRFSFSLN